MDTINILYQNNDINFDNVNLYLDFSISLLLLIFDTYLGDNITSSDEREKHFKWCWDKNVNNFKKENIVFNCDGELKDYFNSFTNELFYKIEDKDDNPYICGNLIKLCEFIFDYQKVKTRADVDSFIEIYNIFDKNLGNNSKKTNLT